MSMREPAYMNLSDALQRVMQSGLSEPDAKREILQAIGDLAVHIRTEPTRLNPRSRDDPRGGAAEVAKTIRFNLSRGFDVSAAVDWDNSQSEDLGFRWMEVERSDVERLWSKAPSSQSPKGEKGYVPPFMQLMFQAIEHFGLDGEKVVKADEVAGWFEGKRVKERLISRSLAKAMTTLVREPDLMGGGNRKLKRDG
jgi:hypothetical protein